jgi:hypothetical protein
MPGKKIKRDIILLKNQYRFDTLSAKLPKGGETP